MLQMMVMRSVTRLLCVCAYMLAYEPERSRAETLAPPTASISELSSMKVEGQLVKVQGRYYVIKDREGKEVYLEVSSDTELAGSFKPGDDVEVWTAPVEHAIAIRAVTPGENGDSLMSATRLLKGTLMTTDGRYYVLLDADGKEVRVLVNEDTELAGAFKPGDRVEIFTSPIEHAVAIRAAK
ncbi:hypothetical protein YTPLAS18_04810 [Nitrospira sp.]|nr:hypothetical protein YTPLAS18_04810 [Nitrospira sp.]